MDIESAFQDLGANALDATRIMDSLGLSTSDLHIPQRFSRLQAVIQYLKQFSEDTQRFIVNKSTRGKAVDKLNHVFEYTGLLKEKSIYDQELSKVQKELGTYSAIEDFAHLQDSKLKEAELTQKVASIQENIYLYEK